MLFDERRRISKLILRQVGLPRNVRAMFLTEGTESLLLVVPFYVIAVSRLMFRLQFRRAMLCMRMLDAAVSMRIRTMRGLQNP